MWTLKSVSYTYLSKFSMSEIRKDFKISLVHGIRQSESKFSKYV